MALKWPGIFSALIKNWWVIDSHVSRHVKGMVEEELLWPVLICGLEGLCVVQSLSAKKEK